MASDGKILHGQQFDPSDGVVYPFTQQMKAYSGRLDRVTGNETNDNTEIIPQDEAAAKVTIWDTAAMGEILDTIALAYPGMDNLQLPNQLTALTEDFKKVQGDGATSFPVSQQTFQIVNGSGSGGISPHAEAEASASIVPTVVPTIKEFYAVNVPVRFYLFYMPDGATQAQVLTRLATAPLANATVNAWPKFKPERIILALSSQQKSIRQNASSDARLSKNDDGTNYTTASQWGNGYSSQTGQETSFVDIPPTLHGAFTISPSSSTETATTTVKANTLALNIDGTPVTAAITNEPAAKTITVTGSIFPTSVAATSPTAVPVTGLYLYSLRTQPYKGDRIQVLAEVVDMSYFA